MFLIDRECENNEWGHKPKDKMTIYWKDSLSEMELSRESGKSY